MFSLAVRVRSGQRVLDVSAAELEGRGADAGVPGPRSRQLLLGRVEGQPGIPRTAADPGRVHQGPAGQRQVL